MLLAALFVINCYRAATQSIVHDEALSWQFYLSGPVSSIFEYYTANNHFLATLLFRISTALFGVSALSMRLPTLLAGAWYFRSIFLLGVLVFEDGILFLIAVGLLALNPILLDFLVASRGYGLAIAGLFWALLQMIVYLREPLDASPNVRRVRLWKAAAGLGIAFAANLTMLIPDAILAVLFGILIRRRIRPAQSSMEPPDVPSKKKKKKKIRKTGMTGASELLQFFVPLLLIGLAYGLAAPIETAEMQNFYTGASSAMGSLRNLMEVSFAYGDRAVSLASPLVRNIWLWCVAAFLAAAVAAGIITTLRILRGSRVQVPTAPQIAVILTSTPVVFSAFLLVLAHMITGLPYPEDRTGLYFVPLSLLCVTALLKLWEDRLPAPAWWASVAVCGLLVIAFALQIQLSSFRVWRYDADTERIFSLIEKRSSGNGPIRLGVSWVLEPALNFYRVTHGANWLEPVRRDGFDGDRQYYLVTEEDRGEMTRLGLKEIYRGPVSGTVLATR